MADPAPPLSRRSVVAGAGLGVAVVGGGLLAAGCSTPSAAPAGTPVGPVADVPVGSGRIFEAAGVVVTQPAAGDYAAFSITCPHQGCAVTSVEGTSIVCPCHGSTFALDGSVVQGPAQAALSSRAITVENGEITLA